MLNEVERLLNTLIQAGNLIPSELNLYYDWLSNYGNKLLRQIKENLYFLDLKIDSIFPEILSRTQNINRELRLVDAKLIHPIRRTRPSDRLCLKLLIWLHSTHPQTQNIPLAFSDGNFACWPAYPRYPMLYFISPSAQKSLLFLPLLFHEFGHLLYVCYKQEMDDLVSDLQEELAELLEPASQRSDRFAQQKARERKRIVETWYEWTQELFCDAVGFCIGSSAFVHSFSTYLQMLGRSQFHVSPNKLTQTHPISWLRVKILAERIRQHGYDNLAEELEDTWSAIASTMGIIEDYYGYYDPDFLPIIQQTIDDMLVETDPYSFERADVTIPHSGVSFSPVLLLNQAWKNFQADPKSFPQWEAKTIHELFDEINPKFWR